MVKRGMPGYNRPPRIVRQIASEFPRLKHLYDKTETLPREMPPLGVGDYCTFIDYPSYVMLVVDIEHHTHLGKLLVVAARTEHGTIEHEFPEGWLRRYKRRPYIDA